jgi:hypothetical protein
VALAWTVAFLAHSPSLMQRGTLVSLSTLGLALTVFACRDLTAPLFGSARNPNNLLNPSGTVVVSPGNLHGWTLYNDQTDTACTDGTVCLFVQGPSTPPSGSGSAELATPLASDGKALVLPDYKGTRFDAITDLHYATHRQTADPGNNLAIALQFNVDYDLTDQATGYQGRLVFEPYQGIGGNVPQNTWQTWDAKAGKWWGTKASVPVNGVTATNSCVQATPCTWTQLLAAFPNIGVHASYGAVVLKAGSGWAGFRGNVDQLTIGLSGTSTTFDFELTSPGVVTLVPPDFTPLALFDSLGTVSGPPLSDGPYRKSIIAVEFELHTPLAARQAAIDSIHGIVVGGQRYVTHHTDDGTYYVRIPGATTEALLTAVETLHRQPQVALATWWELFRRNEQSYRRPYDGFLGWRSWMIDPVSPDATRPNWALEFVRAPMAWGCSVGSVTTGVAVVDEYTTYNQNTLGNVDEAKSNVIGLFDQNVDFGAFSRSDHGARVASVLAAVGNDGKGMTGMAWNARLILRDRFASIKHPGTIDSLFQELPNRLLEDHLVASAMAGASVISLSLGIEWPNGEDYSDKERLSRAKGAHDAVTRALRLLAELSIRPLIVISVGNYHVRDSLSGYPAAKQDFPDQVIVVGGLDSDGSVWSQSNTGPLVDVYAPAVHVAQANGNDKIVFAQSGTSFAAPLVAGTAVLLKDFDPSLTAADMIAMIKGGARSDSTGVLKLDAYGALKMAGQRPNAPLCGNRIYIKGTDVVAQKGSGVVRLGAAPDIAFSLNAKHGGRRVEAYGAPESVAFTYASGGWTTSSYTWPPAAPGDGGSYNSAARYTHGGDTLEAVAINQDLLTLTAYDTVTWAPRAIGSGTALPALPNTSSWDCDFELYAADTDTWNCGSHQYYRGSASYRSVRSAVSPQDAASIVAIGFSTTAELGGPASYYTCDDPVYNGAPQHCRDTWQILTTYDSLQLYRIDAGTGAAAYLGSRSGATPTGLTISEDGREFLLSYKQVPDGLRYTVKTLGPNSWDSTADAVTASCVVVSIAIVSSSQGVSLGSSTQLARETGEDCPVPGSMFTAPTFAPMRSPVAGLRLRP